MPIVQGAMYPELRPIIHHFDKLKILVNGPIKEPAISELIKQIDILHIYLAQINKPNIEIITLSVTRGLDESDLIAKVKSEDIDVVFDGEKSYTQKFINSNFYTTEIVQSIDLVIFSIENFLVGNGVAWRLSDPVWNSQLLLRYMEQPGLCHDYYIYMTECQSSGKYTSNQIDRIRYIVNKIKQINYSRDLLHYYIKRLRKAERAGFGDNDSYNLELNYHLSNYFFLIAGALDSIARLLNDFHKMGLSKYSELGLEKDVFIKKSLSKRMGIARVLKTKKLNHWMTFLKKRRNFIAHEGDMRQTSLVKEKKKPLNDDEINSIVDRQMDWAQLAALLPHDMYDAHRSMVFDITRIKHNYEEIAKNIMDVPTGKGHTLWQPLISVDFDYDQFAKVMNGILSKLKAKR